MKDDLNPHFIFNMTNDSLLTQAIKGEIDLVYLAKEQLANRGLGREGEWVGFKEAKEIHYNKEVKNG